MFTMTKAMNNKDKYARLDKAGLAHTVKAPAFPIPSGGEGLVYSLRLDGVDTSDRA